MIDWRIEWDDDGYPTDESLDALRTQPIDFFAAAKFVANGLSTPNSYSMMETFETKDGFTHEPVKVVYWSTGGWSGNEALISTAVSRFDVAHFLKQWSAGGHYRFCVPLKMLTTEERS